MGSRLAGVMASVAFCAMAVAPAHATFPGVNGRIAHHYNDNGNIEILTVNPDGSGRTNVTNNPARDQAPRWSPDGTKIAYVSDRAGNWDIWVMDADGANQTPLTTDPALDTIENWSPDGTRIAFGSDRNNDADRELWVMDANGSNETEITDGRPGSDYDPSWSPDSTKLTFTRADRANPTSDRENVYTVNVDGSGLTLLTADPGHTFNDHTSFWSPDGAKIAWLHRDGLGSENLWSMNPDGSGKRLIYSTNQTLRGWAPSLMKILLGGHSTTNAGPTTINGDGTDGRALWQNHQYPPNDGLQYNYGAEIWSPDARYVAGHRSLCFEETPCDPHQIFVLDADGINLVEIGQGSNPDWQPVQINTYPRPLAAHRVRVSLVPAYQECTSPNRTHGPPLEQPSCAPPVRSSPRLTIAPFSSDSDMTKSRGAVIITTRLGNPSTPADEADVRLRATVTDVWLASDLSDYTGALEARMTMRTTDKDNTPRFGPPGAATVGDTTYSFPIPCAGTPDPTSGSECAVDTTAEALLPGIAKERTRAVWQLGQVRLYDDDGNVFMRQGIFVP